MRIESNNAMNKGLQRMPMQDMDSYSKGIQNQVQAKQQELQKLSENENLSLEDKMKKRQEIQQEISDLNMQLRQHQIEQRKEQQNQKNTIDDMLGGTRNSTAKISKAGGTAKQGISTATMQALITADSSIKMADVKGGIATELKGTARILESEIKQDKVLGVNTEKKEADLAKINENIENVSASQISELAKTNKAMSEAAEADRESSKTEGGKDKKTKEDDEKKEKLAGDGQNTEDMQNVEASEASKPDSAVDVSVPKAMEVSAKSVAVSGQGSDTYVDVRL